MRCRSWFVEAGRARDGFASRVQSIVQKIEFASNVEAVNLGPNCVEVAYDWADDGPSHYEISESDLSANGLLVWKSQKYGNRNSIADSD